VCVVGIGKSNANAIAAHNPARARHYGPEKVPEVEMEPHDWSIQGEVKTFVLPQQLLL